MALNYKEAKNSFFKYISDNLSGELIYYETNPKDIDNSKQHIRVFMTHQNGELISLGEKHYRNQGQVFLQLFTPVKSLNKHGDLVSKVSTLINKNELNDNIILRSIGVVDFGIDPVAPLYNTNIQAFFYYDVSV